MSHFSKVIKPKEVVPELPIYSRQIRSTGDCQDLWAAAEVGLGKSYRTGDGALNPWDLELRCYDASHVASARPCTAGQPAGAGELLGVGTLHTHTSTGMRILTLHLPSAPKLSDSRASSCAQCPL